jgi:ATP-dependent RNA helicase RhlE
VSAFGKEIPSIIFCNRKSDISTLVSSLKRHGFAAEALHGDLTQATRNQTLKEFKEFKDKSVSVLVASDVAARGLDVDKLGLVINFDVPINPEDYVHRIGRTGRAGQTGKAFTLITEKDKKLWAAVEKFIQQEIREFSISFEKEAPVKVSKAKPAPIIPTPEVKKTPYKRVKSERFPSYEHPENVVGFGEFTPAFILKEVSQKHFSLAKD